MTISVLHVIPSVSMAHGGPSKAIVMIEEGLAAAGLCVTTATTDDDGVGRRFTADALPLAARGAERVYARKWTEFYKISPGLVWWLWRNLNRFQVVHVHALFSFSSVAAAAVARWRGVPYIVRPLGTIAAYGMTARRPLLKSLSFSLIERRILRSAAAVHFTSQLEWDEAKVLGVPLRGVIVPLGIDQDFLPVRKRSEKTDLPNTQRCVVLFMSRLDAKKNVEGLLQAFALLSAQQPGVELTIAGSGDEDYVALLQSMAHSLGIAERVTWLGFVDGDRKRAALLDADIFVLPSYSENFGIAVLEAMFAGLPCVVGRGVAVGNVLVAAGGGIEVEPEPAAIADALLTLVRDSAQRLAMADKALCLAESRFSKSAMIAGLLELYNKVLDKNAVRAEL